MNSIWTYSLLFIGSFIAVAISGCSRFWWSIAIISAFIYNYGTTMAVPILTIAQLIGNLSRVFLGVKQIKWKPVCMFILGAVPMSVLGGFSFIGLPKEFITRGIGFAIIVFVALKYFIVLEFEPRDKTMLIGGTVDGLISLALQDRLVQHYSFLLIYHRLHTLQVRL